MIKQMTTISEETILSDKQEPSVESLREVAYFVRIVEGDGDRRTPLDNELLAFTCAEKVRNENQDV